MRNILKIIFLSGVGVDAFPRIALDVFAKGPRLGTRAGSASPPQGTGNGLLPLVPPPFDAASQYVSTEGQYAWVEPGPTDQRGECPGLNAMANHGYLPHSGIGTVADFATACQTVYGMAPDLAAFLALYGAVVDGTLTSWSVGGTPHLGIAGAHGNYESDSSSLFGDIHQYGNSDKFIYTQFHELYNAQPDAATANYNLDVLRDFRKTRFDQSVDNNPLFFYNVFSGTVVTQAGYTFTYRFFSNKSEEYPEGVLDKEVFRYFYSLWFGSQKNPKHKFGYERIPDNWYKRNEADAYDAAYLESDILYFSQVTPEIPLPGCNAGTRNSYQSIDPSVLTNGAYTQKTAAQQPLCFSLQYTSAFLPTLTGLGTAALEPLQAAISTLTGQLGNCPAITSINNTALQACPGFALYGGPKGKIAPGAVPN